MKYLKAIVVAAVSIQASSLSAQESETEQFSPAIIEACNEAETNGGETYYNECFREPDGAFYGRAYTYFSMENADLQALIEDSDRKRSFWNALKDLIVKNKDSVYVVMRASALNSSGQRVSLGTVPFLRIVRNGSKNYQAVRVPYDGSLPPRFLADGRSEVTFELGVIIERKGESQIAQLLDKAAQLTGIPIPAIGQVNLTDPQKQFLEIDRQISELISYKGEFTTITPLKFRQNERHAFETTAALAKFIPPDAGIRVIVAAYPQTSIFPEVSAYLSSDGSRLAEPGGRFATEIRTTTVSGVNLFEALIAELGQERAIALRFGNNPEELITACQVLNFYAESSAVPLTSDDRFRLEWALMSGNQTMSNAQVRNSSCMTSKEAEWAKLGLGLPQIEAERLSEDFEQIKQRAAVERDAARQIYSQAIAVRDMARTQSERAIAKFFEEPVGNKDNSELFTGQINPIYRFSGKQEDAGAQTLGLGKLEEKFSERDGNLYEGQITISNGQVVLQGFGQYSAVTGVDTLGFKEYVGTFDSNLGTGHGRILFADGSEYLGQTSREKPHGFGVLRLPNNSVEFGEFFDGVPRGRAVKVYANGDEEGGEFDAEGKFRPTRR